MARRRVQADYSMLGLDPARQDENILDTVGYLKDLQGIGEGGDLYGTSQIIPEQGDVILPDYSAGIDRPGVDDVPGIPEGIELLADLAGAESREDAIDSVAPTMPPESKAIVAKGGQSPSLMSQFKDYSDGRGIDRGISEEMSSDVDYTIPEAVEALPDTPLVDQVKETDIPSEGLGTVPGAVEAARSNEKIVNNIKNILKLKKGEIPEEVWNTAIDIQNNLSQQESELDYVGQQLRAKINSGDLSTLDKIALGIALATPVIMGMVLGKEAFFSSLGGVGKGLSDAITQRDKMNLDILDKIKDVQSRRKDIAEKRSKIKDDLIKNIENPGVRKLFNNYDIINVAKDAEGNPEITIGKDARAFGDTIGLTAGDESEVLWYDTNLIRDDDDVKNFKAASKDGKIAIGKMKDANKVIDDVVEIMGIIKAQRPGIYNTLVQHFQPAMYTDENSWKKFIPLVTSKAKTIEVVGDDGKIKTVQALPVLRQKITALQDVYNKEYLGGNRLTGNMLKHWEDVFPDASSVTSWLKSDYDTMYQRAIDFKNILNQRARENLVAEGFIREPLEKILPIRGGEMLDTGRYQSDVVDIERNPEKYRSKVK